ncbi:hypothetical protein [Legionella israelensis]|uniref:Uncharacterized protein n=1 Tax=Legionella israelensis TaxID=454 RepID=A0A0W0V7K8_9GAMM|nr:hypothetical protein [Legionella israelensis]KTD15853.1 hypothetical protein Lisr_2240 [Legionella israelensis]QBS09200.1 hypothetical protein E4T55_04640 [Legionella israelensis]SCY23070.1 hypothetical protein SAMN02746069_01728 [Legionella israelensis DSM 19235]STX58939.1 Uncharacterised protein [Legionella israelensis]
MALSREEQTRLANEYMPLVENFVAPELQVFWRDEENKKAIIQWCIDNDLRLYNLTALKISEARRLMSELQVVFSTEPEKMLAWKNEFESKLLESDTQLREMHHSAYLSVADQYQKTEAVSNNTLLTVQDMKDLFRNSDSCEEILVSEPFSLTEASVEQREVVQRLIEKGMQEEKTVFLPVTHDGHWFYLKNEKIDEERVWSVQDSKPLDEHELTPRQESMLEASIDFLETVGEEEYIGECGENLVFETTGEQLNPYDCGSRVVNAYRSMVDEEYQVKSHKEILVELLQTQLPVEEQPEDIETVFVKKEFISKVPVEKKAKQVIETTVSAQACEEKRQKYRENVSELVNAVVKEGLFADIKNKLAIETLDSAVADKDETDEDFAKRLQEAEFRKVGLKS